MCCASKSEIVVLIKDKEGRIRGLLDVGCRMLKEFSWSDQEGLEKFVALLGERCAFDGITSQTSNCSI